MIGIYKITNLINGYSYIGQSVDIKRRWRNHKNFAFDSQNKSYDTPLYRAFRKYGIENFSFEVLQECTKDELNMLERKYIEEFDTFFNGYNLTLGGDSSKYSLVSEQVKGIISDLKNTCLSQKEIAKKWNVHENTVQTINTGVTWHQNIEYPIRKIKKAEKFYCIDCGIEISHGSQRCTKCYAIHQRKVIRPNREQLKDLIRTKSFAEIGRIYNVNGGAIKKWCIAEKLPYLKSIIKNISDENWNNDIFIPDEKVTKIKPPHRKIQQYSLDGEYICTYSTYAEANEALGKNRNSSHISEVCRGLRKTAFGYIWKYEIE